MEETNSKKKKIPPKWWTKVISDLERASLAAQKSYKIPNVVIGIETNDATGSTIGYIIRMNDGNVGYYPQKDIKKHLPVGARIKGNLPKPQKVIDEPLIESYAYEVVKENVALIPRLWLRKVIGKIIQGEPITMKQDLKAFPEWILLPADKKVNKDLIDLLYRATRYEGIKGLSRFNDILQPGKGS